MREVPKPNRVVGGSIPGRKFVSLLYGKLARWRSSLKLFYFMFIFKKGGEEERRLAQSRFYKCYSSGVAKKLHI